MPAISSAISHFLNSVALLNPEGSIAEQEHQLILTATLLMLAVVIPVFIMTIAIAWRYRAGNKHAAYTPDWEHSLVEEFIWWAIPLAIIVMLAVITWTSSHRLDPYQPLLSDTPPMTIDVVALDWKWLFIYPEQHIATVNYLEIPADTPITFKITADAPMNSFWIPQLGGQIYAMPGMVTELHLMADGPGVYAGSSANFSGDGFSGMRFTAHAVSSEEFSTWVGTVRQSAQSLSLAEYPALAATSTDAPPAFYASVDPGLYNQIVDKYMLPPSAQEMTGMDMSH